MAVLSSLIILEKSLSENLACLELQYLMVSPCPSAIVSKESLALIASKLDF
jgi:hypothetical protein